MHQCRRCGKYRSLSNAYIFISYPINRKWKNKRNNEVYSIVLVLSPCITQLTIGLITREYHVRLFKKGNVNLDSKISSLLKVRGLPTSDKLSPTDMETPTSSGCIVAPPTRRESFMYCKDENSV